MAKTYQGQSVTFTAIGKDEDNDTLCYNWKFDDFSSTYTRDDFEDLSPKYVVDENKITVTIPETAHTGDVYHYLAKVSDDETLGLIRYVDVSIEVVEESYFQA